LLHLPDGGYGKPLNKMPTILYKQGRLSIAAAWQPAGKLTESYLFSVRWEQVAADLATPDF
jgi:hypothetical protein